MASCECCWQEAARQSYDVSDAYHRVLKAHEDEGCVCTKDTPEGRRARAGQFWKDGQDMREAPLDAKEHADG